MSGELNVATAVLPGRGVALRLALARLPRGQAGPFRRVPGVHSARWVIVEGWPKPGDEALWYGAVFDGTAAGHLAALRARLAPEAAAVWGHCAGWPGTEDPHAFERWMLRHRVATHYDLRAYPGATVEAVHGALERRDALTDLAVRARRMTPTELAVAFRERFG